MPPRPHVHPCKIGPTPVRVDDRIDMWIKPEFYRRDLPDKETHLTYEQLPKPVQTEVGQFLQSPLFQTSALNFALRKITSSERERYGQEWWHVDLNRARRTWNASTGVWTLSSRLVSTSSVEQMNKSYGISVRDVIEHVRDIMQKSANASPLPGIPYGRHLGDEPGRYRLDFDYHRRTVQVCISSSSTLVARGPSVCPFVLVTAPHGLCWDRKTQTRAGCDRLALPAASRLGHQLRRLCPWWKVEWLWPTTVRREVDLNRHSSRSTTYRQQLRERIAMRRKEQPGRPVLVLDIHSFRGGRGRIGTTVGKTHPFVLLDHCLSEGGGAEQGNHPTWLTRKIIQHLPSSTQIVCSRLGDVRSEWMERREEADVLSVEIETDLSLAEWHSWIDRLATAIASVWPWSGPRREGK